ncbi:MAG: hypothetical protein CMQ07_09275 [Gammaproteobacteria bacterium]|nr:hypothetical protein [Gammaproteobacteria bacterium]
MRMKAHADVAAQDFYVFIVAFDIFDAGLPRHNAIGLTVDCRTRLWRRNLGIYSQPLLSRLFQCNAGHPLEYSRQEGVKVVGME